VGRRETAGEKERKVRNPKRLKNHGQSGKKSGGRLRLNVCEFESESGLLSGPKRAVRGRTARRWSEFFGAEDWKARMGTPYAGPRGENLGYKYQNGPDNPQSKAALVVGRFGEKGKRNSGVWSQDHIQLKARSSLGQINTSVGAGSQRFSQCHRQEKGEWYNSKKRNKDLTEEGIDEGKFF